MAPRRPDTEEKLCEDARIVAMYHARDEQAIAESARKYGKYCHTIAYGILHSDPDAEECVNDTYIQAWESMPPHRPTQLAAFLGKLTRNLAISRYRHDHAQKRYDGPYEVSEEMLECVPDRGEGELSEQVALRDAINGFLGSLSKKQRIVFLRRYWYFCTIVDIARSMGMSESNVKVTLLRTRNKFKEHLEKEGIFL